MSESTDPPTRAIPTPGEMPWVISYLRDDIQNLRQDLRIQIKAGHDRIDETNKRTDETNKRIDETNKRIDETSHMLGEQIRAVHKRMDTYFLWIMGTLVTVTGILIAVIKL